MRYINKLFLILFLLFTCTTVSAKQISIYLFHSSDCVHCKAEIKYLDELKEKYDIKIYKYEVMYDQANREILKNVRDLMNDSVIKYHSQLLERRHLLVLVTFKELKLKRLSLNIKRFHIAIKLEYILAKRKMMVRVKKKLHQPMKKKIQR